MEIFSADVIDAFNYAKTKANKEFPTVWILDPYDPKQLPWNVVEGIASLESQNYTYNDGSKRRPELIINLFTSYIQRFSDNNPELLSIALGMKKEEWEPLFKEYLADSTNKLEAILKLYSKRLSEYYKKPPITILVKDISNRVVVYCIIFCSEHKAAYYQVLINEIRELDKYIIEELQPEAEMIRKRKKMGKEQRDLFSFT